MPGKAPMMLMLATVAAIACQPAHAQNGGATAAAQSDSPEPAKTLRAAAEALGMLRWSDIGTATIHLPAIDVVNTMELWGNGTAYVSGQAFKTEYRVSLAYNPAAMRVEVAHTIQVVRDAYAWDESELGGGLVPGKGTATPAAAMLKSRLLQLWTLPYGVVKAGLSAGDKTKISTENGATVITFPFSGELAGVTVKATLNPRNEIAKVETRADNPALGEMLTETEYSDYADHGEILTDIKSPGHIVQRQRGRPVLDIQVKMVDANNPYLVFPVPDNIKKASAR